MKMRFRNLFLGINCLIMTGLVMGSESGTRLSPEDSAKKIVSELQDIEGLLQKELPNILLYENLSKKEDANGEAKGTTYFKHDLNLWLYPHLRAIADTVQQLESEADVSKLEQYLQDQMAMWTEPAWFSCDSDILKDTQQIISGSLYDAIRIRRERGYCVLPEPLCITRKMRFGKSCSTFPMSPEKSKQYDNGKSRKRKLKFGSTYRDHYAGAGDLYCDLFYRLNNQDKQDKSRTSLLKTRRIAINHTGDENKKSEEIRQALTASKAMLWDAYSGNAAFLKSIWTKLFSLNNNDDPKVFIQKEICRVRDRYCEVQYLNPFGLNKDMVLSETIQDSNHYGKILARYNACDDAIKGMDRHEREKPQTIQNYCWQRWIEEIRCACDTSIQAYEDDMLNGTNQKRDSFVQNLLDLYSEYEYWDRDKTSIVKKINGIKAGPVFGCLSETMQSDLECIESTEYLLSKITSIFTL